MPSPLPGKPFTIRPLGLSDSTDGSNTFAGAMSLLQNLIPAPGSRATWLARPAATPLVQFAAQLLTTEDGTTLTTEGGIALETDPMPGGYQVFTALLVVGNRVYGMASQPLYPGKDAPFCYDITAGALVPISGASAANLPTSPLTIGDWIPPDMAMIGSRIMVTHPGFDGVTHFLGWIDLSNFTLSTRTANTTNGSPVLTSWGGPTSAPILDGVEPGMLISGAGIPAGTTVLSLQNGTFSLNTVGSTHSNTTVDGIPSTAGVLVGMNVAGANIVAGTTVAAVAANSITLSVAATGTAANEALVITGGGSVTMSANATATATGVAITVAGGTTAAPLWGSGNTNTNPLASVPVSVANFNNRAWYAVGNAAVWSDALNPTQVTNANQALLLGDTQPITSLNGLPLTSQVTGGIIQSLTAFKGDAELWQITGDAATSNLVSNAVAGSTGTLAPNTIVGTPWGTAYMSPDGLRILTPSGLATEPVGAEGEGVCVPFIFAINPSRMCAAWNQNVYRITVQNGNKTGQPFEEYWYDFKRKMWSGPHTCTADLIEPYQGNPNGFVSVLHGVPGTLFQSMVTPTSNSTYVENGKQLTWQFKTTLLPDNEEATTNAIVESTLALALPSTQSVGVLFTDENSKALGYTTVNGTGQPAPTWGALVWGGGAWGQVPGPFQQYQLPWPAPIVFKQGFLLVTGQSSNTFAIGDVRARIEDLGYLTVSPLA